MLTPAGPKILEYNVRFGDPECQVVVPRFASDLGAHLHEAATGKLVTPVEWTADACVTVVLAAEHYPASPRTGDVITGLEVAAAVPGAVIFHAGTRRTEDGIVTAGGRVLSVTATGPTIAAARQAAYAAAGHITWPGLHHRTDIAEKAAAAE
jgi:phosphoribosylamine--glycine ligase